MEPLNIHTCIHTCDSAQGSVWVENPRLGNN